MNSKMIRNQLRYLLFLVIVGLLSILYNTYYMAIIFLTVLAIPIFMFGLLSYIFGKLKVDLVSAVHISGRGENIPVTVQLNNPTIFPISNIKIYLSYKNSYSSDKHSKVLTVSVDARTKTNVTFELYSNYAGNIVITLKGVRVYDYLKLFSRRRRMKSERKAAVLPYYYEIGEGDVLNHPTSSLESEYYSSYKSGDDPSEVFAIREYREGDRLQRIHWKLSIKQDQLMIKEFSDPVNCSILLQVDLCVPRGEHVLYFINALLEASISLSYTFLSRGQLHYFTWYDAKHGSCQKIRVAQETDLFEAVDSLLGALPYEASTDALMAYMAEYPKEQYSDFYYVTGQSGIEKLKVLSLFYAQSKHMIYLYHKSRATGEQEDLEKVEEDTGELGIHLCSVDTSDIRKGLELP